MRGLSGLVATLTAAALVCAGSRSSDAAELDSANKRVAVGYLETLFNKHDAAAAYRLYAAPDFHHHAQWSKDNAHSPQEIVAHNIEAMAHVFQQFPAWHVEIKAVVAEGNMVVVHVLSIGGPGSGETIADAKRGNRQGIRIGDEVVNIFRMADGKIAEHWEILQPLTSLDDVF